FTFCLKVTVIISAFGKSSKVFFFCFFVFLPFYSFTTETTSQTDLCRPLFQEELLLPSINTNDLAAIRDRLSTNQGIGGAATVGIEQPFSPEISKKLREFTLLQRGSVTIIFGRNSDPSWLQSGTFSPEEVNTIKQELDRYFEQIKQIIFQVDGRDVELRSAFFSTEKTAAISHIHEFISSGRDWVGVTHALIGSGTWYETIYSNEKQMAVAKTGETLFLSEPYRMASLSGIPEKVLDGYLANFHGIPHLSRSVSKGITPPNGPFHGSSPGKRLMLISFFKLKGNFMDSGK
ncbi:MAG: hypothetical protein OXB86_05260, partial [Bdellovibrionales bacterium]|nr:hypothetical protein [Bdellovibrionales bacterium]